MKINKIQASVIIKEIETDGHSPLLIISSDFIELTSEEVNKIKGFLFHKERNKKVFEEYIFRLKQ